VGRQVTGDVRTTDRLAQIIDAQGDISQVAAKIT